MSAASADADVLVVCGATAAGKSAVALWLADQQPSTIISADSRQIYRGFDVGTAKPTAEEQARIPHRGVDVCDPLTRYSAAVWAVSADAWIAESIAAGRRPIVVGGTGLYLRALFEGLFVEPELDKPRRAALEEALGRLEVAELRRWAELLDPPRAHLGRTQLVRSIEIALLTGRRLSALHRERPRAMRWRARYLLVDPGASLAARIARRLDEMLDAGWPDEVQRLMQTVSPEAPAWNATGYDVVRAMVSGTVSMAQAREQILIATRQYAKRQRTWFRHQLPPDAVTHLNPDVAEWTVTVGAWAASA